MSYSSSYLIGKQILYYRKMNGISINEISKVIGISPQQQSRYENGEVNIHVDTIYQLAQIFNVSPTYFFTTAVIEINSTELPISKKNYFSAEALVF